MPLIYDYWTGHLHEIIQTLHRSFGQYVANALEFKVGLTTNPDARWLSHQEDGWDRMVVIYRTTSCDYAVSVEDDLILHGWSDHIDALSWNEVRGGGGAPWSASDYYIYILLD